MNSYDYLAKDRAGNSVRGALEAESRAAALATLRDQHVTVIELVTSVSNTEAGAKSTGSRRRHRAAFTLWPHVGVSEKALLCRQLAVAVNAGVPLLESIEAVSEDLENPTLAGAMQKIIDDLHAGKTFSEALASHRKIFSTDVVAVIRAAEEAGSMARTLDRLATAMERTDRLMRKIRTVTAYPAFVAFFFFLVGVVMTVFILPKFSDIFAGFGARLPLITRVVFRANNFLLDNYLVLLIGILGVVAVLYAISRTKSGRLHLDELKYRMPLMGPWLKKYAVARFCRHLAMMLEGGVPITTAMEISAGICANKVLEASVDAARLRIVGGAEIAASLGADGTFPRLVVRMIHVGETSGRLPEVLDKVSDVYEDQVEGSISVTMALFEPIVIAVFGGIVLCLVLAIYMPVFLLASTAK